MCKHDGAKHTNDSQFYVTMGAPLTFLDNENVVFGRVIQGMQVLDAISQLETLNEQPTTGPVKISECGSYSP
jgi:cyclophilin family peptidyl-prolyl cis-trans isomerase